MKRDELGDLAAFLAVAEERSFTGAVGWQCFFAYFPQGRNVSLRAA